MKHPATSNRLAAAVAVAALACATAWIAGAGATAKRVDTLDLTGTITSEHVALDVRPAGMSPGDIDYLVGKLFRHGKPFGRFQGVCTAFPQSGSQCSFTLGLPQGQVVMESAYGAGFNTGPVAREAIVGGTGAYAAARGQGVDRELSETRLAIHLELKL
jgi:hypothetical protein